MTKFKIEMLDDSGNVAEICWATTDPFMACEDHYGSPVACAGAFFVWLDSRGIEYSVCKAHLEADEFARFARVEKVTNPETGEAKYPLLTSDGFGVDEEGRVIDN